MHRIDFSMIRNDHSCFVSLRGTDEIASRPGFVCLHFFYYYHYYYSYFLFWCAIRLEQLLLSFLFLHFDSVGPRTISRSHKTSTATRRRHRPICLFIGSRGNGIVGRFGCFFFLRRLERREMSDDIFFPRPTTSRDSSTRSAADVYWFPRVMNASMQIGVGPTACQRRSNARLRNCGGCLFVLFFFILLSGFSRAHLQ